MKRLLAILLLVSLLALPAAVYGAKAVPEPVATQEMTMEQLASANSVDVVQLLKGLKVPDSSQNRSATLASLKIDNETAKAAVRKLLAFQAEEKSKDWVVIFTKFALWAVTIVLATVLLRKGRVTARLRTWQVFGAFVVFGVILGSDPSPMGTVKDAIVLLGLEGIVFPPRLVALTVFLATVVLANKVICGWGCQFGTLQEWIYRVSPLKKVRLSFAVTNGIRAVVLVSIAVFAFGFALDPMGEVDPFKVFSPSHLTMAGIVFVAFLLLGSLVMYRPWCMLMCPFGFVSWIAEQVSWYKIRVDREKCILCGACQRACPTQHATDLIAGARGRADCFACGNCLQVCRQEALRFDRK